jgi:hypothetical protein
MSLFAAHLAFLADPSAPAPAERLATALADAGFLLDSWLLEQHRRGVRSGTIALAGSPWAGRPFSIRLRPPVAAEAGHVWFDPLELAPMLLVPRLDYDELPPPAQARVGRFVGWLGMRPVARWQLEMFLERAELKPHRVEIPPPVRLCDRTRLLNGPETARATDLTPGEASMYAHWLGKGVAHLHIRQEAVAWLGDAAAALWPDGKREWAGNSMFDEGSWVVVSPETLDLDPRDEEDMLLGDFDHARDIGFRTAVSTQIGLHEGAGGPTPGTFEDVYLARTLSRGAKDAG